MGLNITFSFVFHLESVHFDHGSFVLRKGLFLLRRENAPTPCGC
jgi:hypothetical protein